MSEPINKQQSELLYLAQTAIQRYVQSGEMRVKPPSDPELLKEAGAFVTLRIDGRLRGCTGYLKADKPLSQVIQEMAVAAASTDPRFPPLSENELEKLTVGISVLSPLSPVKRIEDIRVGEHGLLIAHLGRRGVLLPQVPVERGWDRETFLINLCYKAGLPADAWKSGAHLFSFTAEIFGVD